MKSKLEKYFGGNIIIAAHAGKPNVVTFRTNADIILREFWEPAKSNDTHSSHSNCSKIKASQKV